MDRLHLCFIWYVVFVTSVVLHEAAHALLNILTGCMSSNKQEVKVCLRFAFPPP